MKKHTLIIVFILVAMLSKAQEFQIKNNKILESKISDKTYSKFIKSFPIIDLPFNQKNSS